MGKITVFKNITDSDNPYYIGIDTAIGRIRSGKNKELIEKIRTLEKKADRDKLKMKLPSYCFSGEFKKRSIDGLISHSGYVAIDFDHVDNLAEFKFRICKDPIVHVAFISPSGDGLKVIVKIPASVKTHKQSCIALEQYFNDEKLDSFEDVSRVCYESYDPNIHFNIESLTFETLAEKKEPPKRLFTPREAVIDFDEILSRLESWMDNELVYYADGNKHNFLVKLSAGCNRFGIPESVCSQKLIFGYSTKASPVNPEDIDKIVRIVYKNQANLSCTAIFEKDVPLYKISKKRVEKDIFDITLPLKDVIYLDNVRESMIHTFHSGLNMGETTHFQDVDYIYRMKRGELTLFHGIMNHGKSTFLMQLLLIKAVKDNYKFAVFSPEQNPPDDFFDDLVHMYVGFNTQLHYKRQMSIEQYIAGMDFIKEHFYYIYPEDEAPTPQYINERFEAVIKKHKVDGCVIDPYNQLDNDIAKEGGREDLYLSRLLTKQKRFALRHDIFMFIVSHPKGNLKKDSKGDYEIPNVYDLSGGAMWGNKCDNILYVHRPNFTSDKLDQTVKIGSQKIKKHKLCGKPGDLYMVFDTESMRYLSGGNNPLQEDNVFTINQQEVPF